MARSAHGHQSTYQGQNPVLRHENDTEKKIQAQIVKDGLRIREFFIDFDKLRKGVVGEAAVSEHITAHCRILTQIIHILCLFLFSSAPASVP